MGGGQNTSWIYAALIGFTQLLANFIFKKGERSVFKKHFLQKSVDNKVRMKPLEYILIVNLNMTSTGEDEFMNGPEVVVCGSTSEYIVEYYTH